MKLRKHAATCAVSALLVLALTGCSTTVGTNWSIYSRYMKQVLGGSNTKTTTAASSAASTATAIDAPASFTVSGDSYTFSGVDNAAQYLIYLCEKGSANDDDDFKYSGVVNADGSAEYTGSVSELTRCAYGEYTAKVFAVAADYTMSKGVLADYSISGTLPAPELAYSYDGHGILTLQLANSSAYDKAVTPDEIAVTISGPVEQEVKFDEGLADFDVEKLEAGDYTITAVAKSSNEWVTAPESETSELTVTLGTEEIASDNYTKPKRGGMGGGMGGADWEVKPAALTIAEGESGFTFKIGGHDFFKTTATLADTPDEGAAYTYMLAKGDPNAPFDVDMRLELMSDGTAEVIVEAAGPISAAHKYGTWVNNGGTIEVTW